jgi:hypothetical protein
MTVLGREAVVIIHGIGEQAPLSTVRSFVGRRTFLSRGQEVRGGVVSPDDRVFAEPSPAAARTDDLAYVVAWNQTEDAESLAATVPGWRTQERTAVTEFHEFYWAPRFRATTLGHITGWLVPLLLRRLRTFTTPRLVGPHGVVRALPALVLLAALGVAVAYRTGGLALWVVVAAVVVACSVAILVGTFLGLIGAVKVLALCVLAVVVASGIVWGFGSLADTLTAVGTSAAVIAVGGIVASQVTRTLGDAARYLGSSDPGNVEENEVIRERVLELLTRLHDARDPDTGRHRYDRIVVVGHSLGSVIAYDAVRLLWARWSRRVVLPGAAGSPASAAVRAVERAGEELRRVVADPASGTAARAAALEAFAAAQRGAQLVVRDLDESAGGRRWIITDLVTLGCPLTYADAFLATSPADLEERFEERSLAASPPVVQQVRRAADHPYRLWIPGPGGGSTRWHHAAPFACVRWTNAWFEHDIVGGAVGPHFGPGVRDVSLGGTRWLAGMAFAYPHSSYWMASTRSLVRAGSDRSRQLLRDLVRRRPTLLLTAREPLDDAALAELRDLLPAPQDGDRLPSVDVRLYVGATDAARRGAYLPFASTSLPPADVVDALEDVLGSRSRVAVLVSPDLFAPPTVPVVPAGRAADPEPVDEPELDAVGEELEPVGEELDVVGEEE